MKRLIFSILLLTVMCLASIAGNDTGTRIFDRRFRTLKTQVEDNFMAPPVIRLGTNDRIVVNFDEIGEDNSFLEFRLVHCNRDWQPSRLVESEYVEGFNSQRIEDFAFSYATFVHYVNYQVVIPNDDLQIKHSGNYLLQVYDPEEPDEVLLQTRFQVSENLVNIAGEVTTRTDRGHYSDWQQLALALDCSALGRVNPYQDIQTVVMQNMRPETRRVLPVPLRANGPEVIYEHQNELIFPASNEYRRFESVSNTFPGLHVDSLRYMGSNYHVWLKPDKPRTSSQYSYDRTQHGRFLVREYNSEDSNLGADYITVHFLLESPEIPNAEVYVDGEFSHGLRDPQYRMTYDPVARAYKAEIPLKQGAYNYQYVVLPAGASQASPEPLEGNQYETENEYGVEVWFYPPGARADRLAGFNSVWMR